MWERWKQGETLHQIARLFDRPHTSIRQVLAESFALLSAAAPS
jgi:IS30 family transposase